MMVNIYIYIYIGHHFFEKKWWYFCLFLLGAYKFWGVHSLKLTLPWKIHHFDGIYRERWGFSWAMSVSFRPGTWMFHVLKICQNLIFWKPFLGPVTDPWDVYGLIYLHENHFKKITKCRWIYHIYIVWNLKGSLILYNYPKKVTKNCQGNCRCVWSLFEKCTLWFQK